MKDTEAFEDVREINYFTIYIYIYMYTLASTNYLDTLVDL